MGTMMVAQEAEAYADAPQMKRKTKMSLKQRIRNWLQDDRNTPDMDMLVSSKQSSLAIASPREFDADGLTVTIHNANGGYVASFRRYDRKTDRHANQLYVITSDQKFEEALAQCIAMECLSR
jgi:hypothetical protein